MVITLESVSKTIRGVQVLDNITLTMQSGKIYGLQGKNGSGKTMLMKLLCGLIRPSSGTVEIDGQRLGRDISFPPSVSALLENPAFVPGETALQNLKILNAVSDAPVTEEEIRDVLRQVGLADDDPRPYRKFSLGMKQRLGIAAAILGAPRLVVLDEPTNALDSDGVLLLRGICEHLKNAGCLVVLSCHDREELRLLCDRIFVLSEGKITAVQDKTGEGEWTNAAEFETENS